MVFRVKDAERDASRKKNVFFSCVRDEFSLWKATLIWSAKADKTIFRARGFNFFKFRARGFNSFYFARADASTWQNCFNFVLQYNYSYDDMFCCNFYN